MKNFDDQILICEGELVDLANGEPNINRRLAIVDASGYVSQALHKTAPEQAELLGQAKEALDPFTENSDSIRDARNNIHSLQNEIYCDIAWRAKHE